MLMKFLMFVPVLLLPAFGLAAQPKGYTIAFLNKKADSEKIDQETTQKLMEGHMANINRLAEEGKLLAAGPFDGGGGLFIFNTTSVDEAQSWVNTDPAVQAKRWHIEILPYTPRIGSICPVKGDINMALYTFVRFNAIVEKFTAASYPRLIREHEEYVRRVISPADIVTEAIFGPNEGGILILRNELPSDVFSEDPGVREGLLQVETKKLYIARTSFCEN